MPHITAEEAHDIIRILCKGCEDEEEFNKMTTLVMPVMPAEDKSFYWNSYHAVMGTSCIMKAMGASSKDLEKALEELKDFLLKDENVTPIVKH